MFPEDQLILDHYKRVAEIFGHASTSTMKDPKVREAEMLFFTSEIDELYQNNPYLSILEIGCGNGYLLEVLRYRYPTAKLNAVEFTPELCELAQSRNIKDANIFHGDCRDPKFFTEKVDVIITERVIINILQDEQRVKAFNNISNLLNPSGVYLMSESFRDPFVNLNRARTQNFMTELSVPEKNHYLDEQELETLFSNGLKEQKTIIGQNYLSTWFFTSRILHHLVKPEGARKEGAELASFMLEGFGPRVGNYSPILFRKFSL